MLAVLVAAIMSTVSSVLNSSSTIWSIDVYQRILRQNASEAVLWIGTEVLWMRPNVDLQDPIVRDRLIETADPALQKHVAEDPIVWKHLADDAVIKKRLGRDSLVQKHLAQRRLAGWLPWMGPGTVEQAVFAIGRIKPLLNRAAVVWVLCLVAMVVATLAIRQDPGERYDPDTIWNPRWARLPAQERPLNRGWRNLMLWWLLMVAASGSLSVIFH